MHETPDDLATLQRLLDRSYDSAGEHLLRIHTPERRLTAQQVAERLTGMCLLALATVTPDGRPRWARWTDSSTAARSTSARRRTRCASVTSTLDRM
jgi:hypothetical protein